MYARTWELVQELKRDKETAMDYVRAVDEYLSGPEFRYVERPAQAPRGEAPLDYFINQTHEGYCQHYAGAMALMLRMGGVPARVATGFSPGGYSDRKKAWIVRDTDAHAWVEIWFDAYGWVTVDPTPEATPARSLVGALAPDLGASTPGAQADTGADDAASGDAPPISVRPELQTGGVGEVDVSTDESGTPWWLYALGRRRRAGRGARDRALPAPPARADSDGPRDRRGRGRAAPGRATRHDRHDADPARAPARLTLARGLRVPAGAGRGTLRARSPAAVAGGSPRAASRPGAGAGLRRPRAGAVGVAAADRAR